MPPKRDMDEPVNIDLAPDDALRILLRAVNDPELAPVGQPLEDEARQELEYPADETHEG